MNPTVRPRCAQPARSTDPVADELRRYDDHLRNVRGLAAGTRRNHCRIVAQLLRKKFAGEAIDTAKLRPVDVRRFITRAACLRSHSSARFGCRSQTRNADDTADQIRQVPATADPSQHGQGAGALPETTRAASSDDDGHALPDRQSRPPTGAATWRAADAPRLQWSARRSRLGQSRRTRCPAPARPAPRLRRAAAGALVRRRCRD